MRGASPQIGRDAVNPNFVNAGETSIGRKRAFVIAGLAVVARKAKKGAGRGDRAGGAWR